MTERMGVLSSDGRCLQPSPLAARAMLRPAARRLAAVGIGFAGGWAVLYGALMPFGLGLTLGLAEDCFAPCAAGAALGLLLHGLGALSLRSLCQLCALGAAVAARWLLPQKFVPAALAGCGTLTGMALCFALGSSGADLLLYSAADALLAAGIGFANLPRNARAWARCWWVQPWRRRWAVCGGGGFRPGCWRVPQQSWRSAAGRRSLPP